MKMLNVFLSALVLFSVSLTVSSSAEEMSDSLLQAKQMEYMQLGQPGPEHAFLKKLTGSWNLHISYWMSPNTEPMVLTSSGENKMILGGRFLELTSRGEFMGQTMETITMMGFDRRSKQYTSTKRPIMDLMPSWVWDGLMISISPSRYAMRGAE